MLREKRPVYSTSHTRIMPFSTSTGGPGDFPTYEGWTRYNGFPRLNPELNGAKLGQFGMVLRPEGTRGFSPGFQPWERDPFDDAPCKGAR